MFDSDRRCEVIVKLDVSIPNYSIIEFHLSFYSFSHGYNGENDLTKSLHTLPENEILYVIGPVCIIYEPNLKQQRFYIEHSYPITW